MGNGLQLKQKTHFILFMFLPLLLCVFIFAKLGGSSTVVTTHAAASTINGASLAICNGSSSSKCTNPSSPFPTYSVGNLNDGNATPISTYVVYRPAGLTPSQSNLAPAVLVFGGAGICGSQDITGRMIANQSAINQSLATENKFVVVWPEVPCSRPAPNADNWIKEWVNGPSQVTPNDETAVTAIVNQLTACPASGAAPNQCIDPQRIYADGGSSGGNMTEDIMCDPTNSPKFRGFEVDSSALQLYGSGPDCPAANGAGGAKINQNYFLMIVSGTTGSDAGVYAGLANHYNVNPNATSNGEPFIGTWASQTLGCTSSMVSSTVFSTNNVYTYAGPCKFATAGSQAIEVLIAVGGSHQWYCQDSDADSGVGACSDFPGTKPPTNGLFVDQQFWNFVSQGTSSVGSSGPAQPAIQSFSASPTSVQSGGSTTLSWASTNATGCTSNGWSGSKGASGTAVVSNLTSTTTFTLTCVNSGLSASAGGVTVTVTAAPGPPPPSQPVVNSFTVSPSSVPPGSSANLSWQTTNATSCSISGGNVSNKNTSGSNVSTGNLSTTTSFTLTCINGSLSASGKVTVNVNQTAPLNIANPTSGPPPVVSGTINLTSGVSNAKKVVYTVDGKSVGSSINTNNLADGKYTVEAKITEANGKVVTKKTVIDVNNHHSALKNIVLRYGLTAAKGGSSIVVIGLFAAAWLFLIQPRFFPKAIPHASDFDLKPNQPSAQPAARIESVIGIAPPSPGQTIKPNDTEPKP